METWKTVLIAAGIGAAIAWAYKQGTGCPSCTAPTDGLLEGALIGAGVQLAVRITGVS